MLQDRGERTLPVPLPAGLQILAYAREATLRFCLRLRSIVVSQYSKPPLQGTTTTAVRSVLLSRHGEVSPGEAVGKEVGKGTSITRTDDSIPVDRGVRFTIDPV